MIVWLDAQLSPALARWLNERFDVDAVHVCDLGLVPAKDPAIFQAARMAGALVLTKDRDFVDVVDRLGPPPQIVWVTSGNTSNCEMKRILEATFRRAMELAATGEPVIEIKG
jgi:predicted nuclease of predicted toxin-antitoxin system